MVLAKMQNPSSALLEDRNKAFLFRTKESSDAESFGRTDDRLFRGLSLESSLILPQKMPQATPKLLSFVSCLWIEETRKDEMGPRA